MDLICFEVEPGRVELRPAARRRGWMEETAGAHAYRCVPLVVANQHGWEMLCPVSFSAVWNGGHAERDLALTVDDDADARARPGFVESHFGSGILTFNPLLVLRTAPGWDLWVTGPANYFKDGVQAMSAAVETDWMPFTFSVNWKLTRPGAEVRFAKGEPFCQFFPIQRGAVAACEPRLAALAEDAALAESVAWARARRALDGALADRSQGIFQGWYAKGEMPKRGAGEAPPDHQTSITVKPFKR
jgi:hypothetical protein